MNIKILCYRKIKFKLIIKYLSFGDIQIISNGGLGLRF